MFSVSSNEFQNNLPIAVVSVAVVSSWTYVGVSMPPVKAVILVMSLLAPRTAAERFARAPAASVAPVPPLATTSVPASVTAPVVAVLGVNPVVPVEKDVTPSLTSVMLPGAFKTVMPAPAVSGLTV